MTWRGGRPASGRAGDRKGLTGVGLKAWKMPWTQPRAQSAASGMSILGTKQENKQTKTQQMGKLEAEHAVRGRARVHAVRPDQVRQVGKAGAGRQWVPGRGPWVPAPERGRRPQQKGSLTLYLKCGASGCFVENLAHPSCSRTGVTSILL